MHAKADNPNSSLPLIFVGHQADLKLRWLEEIAENTNNPLAVHEHSADDIRIDPTQVKPDTEGEAFRLPQRKASYESDGIKPSEVAKDHFLSASERESYAKQLAEEKEILLAQQQSFIERSVGIASAQQQQQRTTSSVTQVAAKEQVIVERKSKAEEKHTKLTRSAAVEKSVESREAKQELQTTTVDTETKSKTQQRGQRTETVTARQPEPTTTKSVVEPPPRQQIIAKDPIETGKRSDRSVVVDPNDSKTIFTDASKSTTTKSIASATAATSTNTMSETHESNAKLTLSADAAAINTNPIHTLERQLALKSTSNDAPSPSDADTGNQSQSSNNNNNNKENTAPNANASRYHIVSTYNFGDGNRRDGNGQAPPPLWPNRNIFLVPPHLITYETSIEINVLKIPAPLPPQPPKFVKKLLVHTESLERKTRAFLSGNFQMGTTDSSLRTARQKIRSLKSTLLNTDDEVKHAEDTITKAHSGDFLKIFHPPIIEKPLYEFIEIPSERSEEECSEYSDKRSERGLSTEQQHENMEDYYSSRYSSRSSRRRVEGESVVP